MFNPSNSSNSGRRAVERRKATGIRRSPGVSACAADSVSLPSVHTPLTGYASHSSGGTNFRGQLYPLAVSTIVKKPIPRWAAELSRPRRGPLELSSVTYGNTFLRETTQRLNCQWHRPNSERSEQHCKSAMRDNAHIEKGTIIHHARELHVCK